MSVKIQIYLSPLYNILIIEKSETQPLVFGFIGGTPLHNLFGVWFLFYEIVADLITYILVVSIYKDSAPAPRVIDGHIHQ